MTYSDTVEMIDFLNYRMRYLKPWYTWGIVITWEKLERWAKHLGWKPSPKQKGEINEQVQNEKR